MNFKRLKSTILAHFFFLFDFSAVGLDSVGAVEALSSLSDFGSVVDALDTAASSILAFNVRSRP